MSLSCPQCQSKAFKRNGYTRHGKQNHRCFDCGRQFSLDAVETHDHYSELEFVTGVIIDGTRCDSTP